MEPYSVVRHGSYAYPVYIGRGVMQDGGEFLLTLTQGRPTFVVTTRSVWTYVRHWVGDEPLFLPDGEAAKSLESLETLVGGLLARGARRDAVLVAVGGGALGDAAGFAASVYLRGIDLIHVPTTLLAQVDSSIGGKVAVNHPMGKNLIGSFHPPKAVLADIDFISSLSEREVCSGALEALKAGVIQDPSLFELIELEREAIAGRDLETVELVVKRAVAVKASVVSVDAKESDLRRLLNYGHTIGHGIEAAMDYEGITHGEAVGLGMIGANAVAVARGLLDRTVAARIDEAIRDLLTIDPPSLDASEVLRAVEHDKKFGQGRRVMILPRDIGHCEIVEDITEKELIHATDRALAG